MTIGHEREPAHRQLGARGSLAAHFEHTVAITSDGPDILSLPDEL